MTDFEIIDVKDLDAAWPDIRRLFLELDAYERPMGRPELRPDWEQHFRR